MSGKPTNKPTEKKAASKKSMPKKSVPKKSVTDKKTGKPPRKQGTENPGVAKPRRWKATLFGLFSVMLVVFAAWLIYLDAEVRRAFDGKKWALPAKVYARPLALYPGLLLSPEQLQAELQ